MSKEKFVEIIKALLNNKSDVGLDSELDEIEEWDSLTRIKFMVLLSQEYGISLPRFDVAEAETICDLWELVQENG